MLLSWAEALLESVSVPCKRANCEGLPALELAFDAKEFYPKKSVTLIHSRNQLLNRFHPKLHSIVKERTAKVGVNLILGQRVKMPRNGFPTSGPSYHVELADGRLVPADVAVSHRRIHRLLN